MNCPICGSLVASDELERHVNRCLDGGEQEAASPSPVIAVADAPESDDADLALARRLQAEESAAAAADEALARALAAEEEQRAKRTRLMCELCDDGIVGDAELFILDECHHKVHRTCLKKYVTEQLAQSVKLECPQNDCEAVLSVRDVKELLPCAKSTDSENSEYDSDERQSRRQDSLGGGGGLATHDASRRLMAELELIAASEPEKSGFEVDLVDENLYLWEIKLFFEDCPLADDLKKKEPHCIVLHAKFPPTFPFAPPFIRVIRPRLQFRTGFVTVGGSICFKLLTASGWSAVNTVEAIIVSIRANMIEGGARLERGGGYPEYNEREAKIAFERLRQTHGW